MEAPSYSRSGLCTLVVTVHSSDTDIAIVVVATTVDVWLRRLDRISYHCCNRKPVPPASASIPVAQVCSTALAAPGPLAAPGTFPSKISKSTEGQPRRPPVAPGHRGPLPASSVVAEPPRSAERIHQHPATMTASPSCRHGAGSRPASDDTRKRSSCGPSVPTSTCPTAWPHGSCRSFGAQLAVQH